MSLGLVTARRTVLIWLHCVTLQNVYFGAGEIMLSGCFSEFSSAQLQHTKTFWTFLCTKLCGNSLGYGAFLFQHNYRPVHKAVHKEMDKRVWCGRTSLACTESWPHPDKTSLEWIRAETVNQGFSFEMGIWTNTLLTLKKAFLEDLKLL